MRLFLFAGVVTLGLLLAACGGSTRKVEKSEWEQQYERRLEKEGAGAAPDLPAYPRNENLLPFAVSPPGDVRFFVDRASITTESPFVRYTLVARSPSGVDNVSYESLNCREREFRSYARGTSEGKWIGRPTEWRQIEPRTHRAQYALHWEYLCPNSIAVYSAAEGISALEKGGHPRSKLPNAAGGGR